MFLTEWTRIFSHHLDTWFLQAYIFPIIHLNWPKPTSRHIHSSRLPECSRTVWPNDYYHAGIWHVSHFLLASANAPVLAYIAASRMFLAERSSLFSHCLTARLLPGRHFTYSNFLLASTNAPNLPTLRLPECSSRTFCNIDMCVCVCIRRIYYCCLYYSWKRSLILSGPNIFVIRANDRDISWDLERDTFA